MSKPQDEKNEESHYRHLDCHLQSEKKARENQDLLCLGSDFSRAALHTAVQTPINSLHQMIPDFLPPVQIVDAPEDVPELSPRWHAQQLGAAAGAAADMAALDLVCDGAVPPPVLATCYNGLLRPVEDSQTKNAGDQIYSRAKNAFIGGVGMMVQGAAAKGISTWGNEIEHTAWKGLAGNKILGGALSGIPAGLATTALSGGAGIRDFGLGVYTSALGGMSLGAIHAAGERAAIAKTQGEELAKLRKEAVTDHLTGLSNRRGSDEALAREFCRSCRTDEPMSLIYGDLDGFKPINDIFGHETGDHVLKEVGRRMQEQKRPYDYAARTGGDEFTLVLPNTDGQTARQIAARLQQAIKMEIGEGAACRKVGISLGVVTRLPGENNLSEFQRRADDEMYRAKRRAGKTDNR